MHMDKVSSRHVTWVDLENPTSDQMSALSQKYMIHPLAAHEVLAATYRPKLEEYDEHLFLVLHFPVFDPKAKSILRREIDFIIFPYNLITIHYEEIPQLDDFQELLAGHEALRERTFGFSSGHLLYHIISRLYAVSRQELDNLEVKAKEIEEKVFSGHEYEVLKEIAYARRDLINFQKALKPHQAVLESLLEHGKQFFGSEMNPYFNDIKGEYTQVWNALENLREMLDTLYETNISLLSANTNEIMKTLAVLTVMVMPASLIAFIYSMDLDWIPLRRYPNAFVIISGIMIFISFSIYRYFKKKRWV